MPTFLTPIALQGQHVRLEPLAADHAEALRRAAADGELWKLWFTGVPDAASMDAYIQEALAAQQADRALAFVVRRADDGAVLGTTRYCNAEPAHRRLEIGYTWYAASAQRTAANTETKLLLLRHAFETMHCIAVEFRTHWLNLRSRAAIARLGAKQDGVLRNHRLMPDGSYRDSVVFSIVEAEWLSVKQHLMFRLAQGGGDAG